MPRRIVPTLILGVLGAFAFTAPSVAQPGADGIDWVTIGAPGNRAYDGPDPEGRLIDRGRVDYEYRIGRFEVTTTQYMEFLNAALARPDPLPFSGEWWHRPVTWGASIDPNYQGPGTRYRLNPANPDAAMLPVGGISWRMAAVMANWLHNDKRTDASAFMSGAYDTSTFTPNIAFPTFTDQAAHSPGARYWIPTLDEWIKAVHYDPDANDGQGRWWQQPNGTDIPLVYGPPPSFGGDGTGQANAGFNLPGSMQYRIPLGSYPTVQSPWGLLDAAGATGEWLEELQIGGGQMYRLTDGSYFTGSLPFGSDTVTGRNSDSPHSLFQGRGLRLASSVPSAGVLPALVLALGGLCGRRALKRRRGHEEVSACPGSDVGDLRPGARRR